LKKNKKIKKLVEAKNAIKKILKKKDKLSVVA